MNAIFVVRHKCAEYAQFHYPAMPNHHAISCQCYVCMCLPVTFMIHVK